MDGKQRRYDGIDWEQLYKRLRICAERLTGTLPNSFDIGVSAEDLVSETLLAFWESPDAMGWKPAKGKITTYLVTVLKNRFIDHYRRMKKVKGSIDDPHLDIPESNAAGPNGHDSLEYQQFVTQLRLRVGDRQELQDLITAAELIDGGHNVNQQLATILHKTEQEVQNLRRQLLNVTGARKLYEQRRRT